MKEKVLHDVLDKYCECQDLSYYRYISYPLNDKKKVIKWQKIIGVLQFKKRFSKTILRLLFEKDNMLVAVLLPAEKPVVLVHLKMYVLAEHHDEVLGLNVNTLCNSAVCSNTPSGFGGRKTKNEICVMRPYIKALGAYKQYNEPDFYKYLPGAKKICEFKYMLEKTKITIKG